MHSYDLLFTFLEPKNTGPWKQTNTARLHQKLSGTQSSPAKFLWRRYPSEYLAIENRRSKMFEVGNTKLVSIKTSSTSKARLFFKTLYDTESAEISHSDGLSRSCLSVATEEIYSHVNKLRLVSCSFTMEISKNSERKMVSLELRGCSVVGNYVIVSFIKAPLRNSCAILFQVLGDQL